jgi:hypothetical protein
MKNKTAVDWFYYKIKSYFEHDGDLLEVLDFTYAIAKDKEKEKKSLLTRLREYSEVYQVCLQLWGKGRIHIYIMKDFVDLYSSHDWDNEEEAIEDALKYLDRIQKKTK